MDEGAWFEQMLVAEIALIEDVAVARKAASVVAGYVEAREQLDERLKEDLERQAGLDAAGLGRLESLIQNRDVVGTDASSDNARDATAELTNGTWSSETGPLGTSRYQEMTRIGSGSMGEVYRARDVRLDRVVAIKVLRDPDDCSDQARERFIAEARIAARVNHPAVIPIYELGITPSGHAYYVMPHIGGGRTLLDAIGEGATAGDRLQLLEPFVGVCDAIHHAHGAGFVHCDIKPANIALERLGEPIVLDWGLARGGPVVNAQVRPSISGTPGYMAPEACGLARGSISPRSDVYSLGATLLHILTGERPPDVSASEGPAAIDAALDRAQQALPEPLVDVCRRAMTWEPAHRTAEAGKVAEGLRAWQHQTEMARERALLERQIRRTLEDADALPGDAAVARVDNALALVGQLRELTPGESLAESLETECVSVRQAALLRRDERARRGTRRKLGAWLLGALAVAGVATALFLNRERTEALDAQTDLQSELDRSQGLVDFMMGDLRESLEQYGKLRLLEPVMNRVLAYSRSRAATDSSPKVVGQIAETLRHLAALRRFSGDTEETVRILREARQLAEGIEDPPQSAERVTLLILSDLASALREMGRLEESLDLSRTVLARCAIGDASLEPLRAHALTRMGDVLIRQGETAEALRLHGLSLRRWQSIRDLSGNAPDIALQLAESQWRAGRAHRTAGDLERSRELLVAARSTLDDMAETESLGAKSLSRLARTLYDLSATEHTFGRFDDAASAAARAKAIVERLHARDPQNATWNVLRCNIFVLGFDIHKDRDDLEEAEKSLKQAHEIAAPLAEADVQNLIVRKAFHDVLERQGDLFLRRRQPAKALEAYTRSMKLIEEITASQSSDLGHESARALATSKIGSALLALGRLDEATARLDAAARIHQAILRRNPNNLPYVERLIWSYQEAGDAWAAKSDAARARAAYQSGLDGASLLLSLTPRGAPAREVVGRLQWKAGEFYKRDQPKTARQHFEDAIAIWNELVATHPNEWRWLTYRAHMHAMIAYTHARENDVYRAALRYREALSSHAPAVELKPELARDYQWYVDQVSLYELRAGLREPENAKDHALLASHLLNNDRDAEAIPHFEKALESEAIRKDFSQGTLYRAACAAAETAKTVASPEDGKRYDGLALKWLREDIGLRRARIEEIEAQLMEENRLKASKQDLRTRLKSHQDHIEAVRTTRFEFDKLRPMKAFEELFR